MLSVIRVKTFDHTKRCKFLVAIEVKTYYLYRKCAFLMWGWDFKSQLHVFVQLQLSVLTHLQLSVKNPMTYVNEE